MISAFLAVRRLMPRSSTSVSRQSSTSSAVIFSIRRDPNVGLM